ncbi:16244_t:CDS:1, partial [Funneliformis geosporum]
RKEERSMKGVHMISLQNMNLHSLAYYLKAMQNIANIPSLKKYLLLN